MRRHSLRILSILGALGLANPAAAADLLPPVGFELVALVPSPLYVTHAGDERLFIAQRNGVIRIQRAGEGLLATPFLDLSALVDTRGGGGLYTLAFHPDFAANGLFFVSYTERGPFRSVIARYRVSADDPDAADPASRAVLLEIDEVTTSHNSTQLAFGPRDGYLYVGTGDGGSVPPDCSAQRGDSLHGKILRLDVDRNADQRPYYAIPPDNPHAASDDGVRDEVWSSGFRHPWRFSFDPVSGDLSVADVGQFEREEIDRQPADSAGGENYGWSVMEGSHCQDPAPLDPRCPASTPVCFDPAYTAPSFEYGHAGGDCGVLGGYVYRGGRIPGLPGRYLLSDVCTKKIQVLAETPSGGLARRQLADASFDPVLFGLTSFGEDVAGELYVTLSHGVYRLVFTGTRVAIDVRPGAAPDVVRPRTRGVLPVAVFGSESFDVTRIDRKTLVLGPGAARPLPRPPRHRIRDLDRDGFPDRVFFFRSDQTGLAPGDRFACLSGEADGAFFGGCAPVRVR